MLEQHALHAQPGVLVREGTPLEMRDEERASNRISEIFGLRLQIWRRGWDARTAEQESPLRDGEISQVEFDPAPTPQ
jgi:hypothetical protein